MKRLLTPTVHIDIKDAPPLEDPKEQGAFKQKVEADLQEGLDSAIAHRRKGVPLSPLGKFGVLAATAGVATVANKLMKG